MGRAHKDFNITIKNHHLKQIVNFAYVGGDQFKGGKYFRHLEVDRDRESCIPGTRKDLVSMKHNNNDNKIPNICLELSPIQL